MLALGAAVAAAGRVLARIGLVAEELAGYEEAGLGGLELDFVVGVWVPLLLELEPGVVAAASESATAAAPLAMGEPALGDDEGEEMRSRRLVVGGAFIEKPLVVMVAGKAISVVVVRAVVGPAGGVRRAGEAMPGERCCCSERCMFRSCWWSVLGAAARPGLARVGVRAPEGVE